MESIQTLKQFWEINENRRKKFVQTLSIEGLASKVIIDGQNRLFYFVTDGKAGNNRYSFSEITGYQFVQLESTTVTESKGGIRRSLIGGAIFGRAGAIVGATTAKKVSKEIPGNTILEIFLNSFSGVQVNSLYEPPPGLTTFLDRCIEENLREHGIASTTSVADELMKLKALLDEDVITQVEFEKAKKKLLDS